MDSIDFIDSNDIRKHLREIGYEPDPVEAAFLIWQSRRKTIEEKHLAWRGLIANTVDVSVPARQHWNYGWESLHKVLREYMRIEEELIEQLKKQSDDRVYQAVSQCIFGELGLAKEFDACFHYARKEIEECSDDRSGSESEWGHFSIKKIPITQGGHELWPEITARFDSEDRLMEVKGQVAEKDREIWDLSFQGMWFDIPIPFQRGDIVRDCMTGVVFVLDGAVPWFHHDCDISCDYFDASDMQAYGATADEVDALVQGRLFQPYRANYLEIEYFKGVLTGNEKILPVYAACLKGNIRLSDFLLYAQAFKHKREYEETEEYAQSIEDRCIMVMEAK